MIRWLKTFNSYRVKKVTKPYPNGDFVHISVHYRRIYQLRWRILLDRHCPTVDAALERIKDAKVEDLATRNERVQYFFCKDVHNDKN